MKPVTFFVSVLVFFTFGTVESFSSQKPKGDYLGEKRPEMKAELFAPGIVSTGLNEFNSSFSPDGKEFYFSIRNGWSQMVICVMKRTGTSWNGPEVVSFSGGEYLDADPFISQDGRKLFFCSNRPAPGRPNSNDWNIWVVEKEKDKWGTPEYLSFNTAKNEMYVSVSNKGTVYFHADYENKTGRFDVSATDIYYSTFDGMKYLPAQTAGSSINSASAEWDPFISPDESYLIFTSPKPGGFGSGDLYISFRQEDGNWGQAKNMGERVNTASQDYCPNISPDGKFFFFTSYKSKPAGKNLTYYQLSRYLNGPQNGSGGDIYWISSKVINELK